jgi:hypothetical protein
MLPDPGVSRALLTQGAPGFLCDLWGGPEPAIGPSARLRVVDALVTRSAPGYGGGPLVRAFLGIVSFYPAYVAGLSMS